MKVVNLSLDPQLQNVEGVTAARNRMYGDLVDSYTIIVHGSEDNVVDLSKTVRVYCVGGINKIVRLFRIYKMVRKLILQNKCDVITSQDAYFFGLLAYFLAKKYHLGFELHILGIEKFYGIRKLLARFTLKNASMIRVNSNRLMERLTTEFGVSDKRINMVPIYVPVGSLGFDSEEGDAELSGFSKLKKDFQERYSGRFNFLTVCRLVAIKNIPMQLHAMQKLVKKHPQVLLHIVGSGPKEEDLSQEVRDLGLEKHVILHGPKEGLGLGVFYTECDSFLLTSFAEGWPMVIFEAATAGIPVIMTDVGCAGEFIRDNESGLVVPVNDVDALESAMLRMIEEKKLGDRLATEAKVYLKGYWTLEQILEGYKTSWEQALANRL